MPQKYKDFLKLARKSAKKIQNTKYKITKHTYFQYKAKER